MSLTDILTQIKEDKKIAETDLDTVSPRALPYKKGQVDSAKHRLESLYVDYKNAMLERAVFILVTGSESELFGNIAQEDYECFSFNAKALFKEIVDEINPQIYQDKQVNASTFDIIGNVLEDKLKPLDIISYNALMFDAKFNRVIKSKNEFVDLVADAVSDIVGPEVIGLDALERTTKAAVNRDYDKKIVPILLHSKDENFIANITNSLRTLNPRVVRIVAGKAKRKDLNPLFSIEETDKSNVGDALKEIATKA